MTVLEKCRESEIGQVGYTIETERFRQVVKVSTLNVGLTAIQGVKFMHTRFHSGRSHSLIVARNCAHVLISANECCKCTINCSAIQNKILSVATGLATYATVATHLEMSEKT